MSRFPTPQPIQDKTVSLLPTSNITYCMNMPYPQTAYTNSQIPCRPIAPTMQAVQCFKPYIPPQPIRVQMYQPVFTPVARHIIPQNVFYMGYPTQQVVSHIEPVPRFRYTIPVTKISQPSSLQQLIGKKESVFKPIKDGDYVTSGDHIHQSEQANSMSSSSIDSLESIAIDTNFPNIADKNVPLYPTKRQNHVGHNQLGDYDNCFCSCCTTSYPDMQNITTNSTLQQTSTICNSSNKKSYSTSSSYLKPSQYSVGRGQQLIASSTYVYPALPETTDVHHNGHQHITLKKDKNNFCIDPELKQMYLNRLRTYLLYPDYSPPYNDKSTLEVPSQLKNERYKYLQIVEPTSHPRESVAFSSDSSIIKTICMKAFDTVVQEVVFLRRVCNQKVDLSAEFNQLFLDRLKTLHNHPNLIAVRDAFSTEAFDDKSVVFVFDFHPSCVTLQQAHVSSSKLCLNSNNSSTVSCLPEPTVWNYLIQLVHGMRYLHKNMTMSCGCLHPSKVLIQDGQRIRLNCIGMKFLLHSKQSPDEWSTLDYQKSDLQQLGVLLLHVSCGYFVNESDWSVCLNSVKSNYQSELSDIIEGLLLGSISNTDELVTRTARRCYEHLQLINSTHDFLERQIMREMESSRLFRLISKLMSICERTDYIGDSAWTNVKDRQLLLQFRDYVFHQIDRKGAPWIDMAHIVSCLNKLDSGSEDRIKLRSHDGLTVAQVQYCEVKSSLDSCFQLLLDHHSTLNKLSPTEEIRGNKSGTSFSIQSSNHNVEAVGPYLSPDAVVTSTSIEITPGYSLVLHGGGTGY